MKKKDLYTKILQFLRKNHNKKYSFRKLARTFRIKKKSNHKLKKTLNRLHQNGKIIKEKNKYSSKKYFKTVQGTFDARALSNNYSFGFVETPKGDVKVYRENCLNAYHNDIVEVAIVKSKKNIHIGKINKIVKRKTTSFIGEVYLSSDNVVLIPDEPAIDNFIDIKLDGFSKEQIANKKVVVEIFDWGDRENFIPPIGRIKEVLGNTDDPNIDYISVLRQFDLPEKFPEEGEKEAAKLSGKVSKAEITRRKDYRQLFTFTIDPETAKDFDDAISLEKTNNGWRLYVHIADVSHYVRTNSSIFAEAFKRGTSIYLLNNVVPMLPKKISNSICSLQPDQDKFTVSILVDFDKNYKILKRMIFPSVIRSNKSLNYKQVDEFFENGNSDAISEKGQEILTDMRSISRYLTKDRFKRGSLNFDLPDTEFEFDENGSPIDVLRSEETQSHLLIEEFMLLANQFVADILIKKCNSAIYRIHEEPDPAKLGEFARLAKSYNYKIDFSKEDENIALKKFLDSVSDHKEHRVFDNLLLRSMMKAKYSYMNSGHFGLALNSYTHFTSPIRRFPDLIVHHLIKQYIFEWSAKKFSLDEMKSFARHSSEMEIVALEAERTLGKIKKNRFMSENRLKVFDAIVVNFNNKNIFVELDKYPIQGFIPLETMKDDYFVFDKKNYRMTGKRSRRQFYLCQKMKIRVKEIVHGIEFELVK